MATSSIEDYYEALERLIKNKTQIIAKGSLISNDNVSLEAGRKKGSIKKSRPVFADLIDAIKKASAEQSKPEVDKNKKIETLKKQVEKYKQLYEDSLGRELMADQTNLKLVIENSERNELESENIRLVDENQEFMRQRDQARRELRKLQKKVVNVDFSKK